MGWTPLIKSGATVTERQSAPALVEPQPSTECPDLAKRLNEASIAQTDMRIRDIVELLEPCLGRGEIDQQTGLFLMNAYKMSGSFERLVSLVSGLLENPLILEKPTLYRNLAETYHQLSLKRRMIGSARILVPWSERGDMFRMRIHLLLEQADYDLLYALGRNGLSGGMEQIFFQTIVIWSEVNGRSEAAIDLLSGLIEQNIEPGYGYFFRSLLWRELKRYDKAEQDLLKTIAADSSFELPYQILRRLYERHSGFSKTEQIIERFKKNLARYSDQKGYLINLVLLYMYQAGDRMKEILPLLDRYHRRYQDEKIQDWRLAILFKERGEFEKAISLLEWAIDHEPWHHYPYAFLAELYQSNGQGNKMENVYERAVKAMTHDAWPLVQLGALYIQLDRYQEAENRLLQAISLLDPESGGDRHPPFAESWILKAYHLLALIYRHQGYPEKILELYERVQ